MKLYVSDHALDRGSERFLAPLERVGNRLGILKDLWRTGTLRRWHDPDDPPGAVTVTSEIDPHWTDPAQEPRYLVARDVGHKIVIVSALTKQQYENNAKCRWRMA